MTISTLYGMIVGDPVLVSSDKFFIILFEHESTDSLNLLGG